MACKWTGQSANIVCHLLTVTTLPPDIKQTIVLDTFQNRIQVHSEEQAIVGLYE